MRGYWIDNGGGSAAPTSKARAAGWSMNAQTPANHILDFITLPKDCYKGLFHVGHMFPNDPGIDVYTYHYDVNVNQFFPDLTLCNMIIHYNCMFQYLKDGSKERINGRFTFRPDDLIYASDKGFHAGQVTAKQSKKYVGIGNGGKGYEYTKGVPIFNLYGNNVREAPIMDIPNLTVNLDEPDTPTMRGPNIYGFNAGDVKVLWDGYFYLYAPSGSRTQTAARGPYDQPGIECSGNWWYDVFNPFTYIELKPR